MRNGCSFGCSAAFRLRAAGFLFAFALAGCGSRGGGPGPMLSKVSMSNPPAATQLTGGFYEMERGAWRWTKRRFGVLLMPPLEAERNGAILRVRLTIPDVVIERLKSISLTGSVNGARLAPETFAKPGTYVYERDVPPTALARGPADVNFELDKSMAPNPPELRELGIVVLSIELDPK